MTRLRAASCQASSGSGGARAGAGAGGSVGRPRCVRIMRTTWPSVRNAIHRRGPPQCGPISTSPSMTRFIRSVQLVRVGHGSSCARASDVPSRQLELVSPRPRTHRSSSPMPQAPNAPLASTLAAASLLASCAGTPRSAAPPGGYLKETPPGSSPAQSRAPVRETLRPCQACVGTARRCSALLGLRPRR